MTDKEFDEWFKYLEEYHNRPQTPTAKQRYREQFKEVSDELFLLAIKAETGKDPPGRFPSADELQRFIDEERAQLARRRPKTAAEAQPDPEVGKAILQRLWAELDQRDREKEHRVVEQRDRDRQDRTQRITVRKQALQEQAQSLLSR